MGRPRLGGKQQEILACLRQEIVSGQYPPGARLPTRTELEQRFGVSTITVQRALDCLVDDGFVHASRKRGTFVADYPPHLSRYGLVLPLREGGEEAMWSRFWRALVDEARRLEVPGQREVPVFFDDLGHLDSDDYQALLREAKAARLAGAIVVQHTMVLEVGSALRESGLPLVGLGVDDASLGIPRVSLNGEQFRSRSFEYFRTQGRRRIAVLTAASGRRGHTRADLLRADLEAAGFECPARWALSCDLESPWTAQPLMQLLMHPSQGDRPDGLLVDDDNLAEYAVAGLVAAGITVPGDMDVIGHCNFPWPTTSALPIKRLGFDIRQVLAMSIAAIDAQRAGRRCPLEQVVPAVFEDEVNMAPAALAGRYSLLGRR